MAFVTVIAVSKLGQWPSDGCSHGGLTHALHAEHATNTRAFLTNCTLPYDGGCDGLSSHLCRKQGVVMAKLSLPCAICAEPVTLSKKRYDELQEAGASPLCKTNGCRSFGPDIRDLARTHKMGRVHDGCLVLCCPKGKNLPIGRWKLRRVWVPDGLDPSTFRQW